MSWSQRERMMLEEMGLHIPAAVRRQSIVADAKSKIPVAVAPPSEPDVAPVAAGTSWDAVPWDQLPQAIAACKACGLCGQRTQVVPGVGPRTARLMIVGEAPGEQEDRRGEPFVGPAGQLLDRMLGAIGAGRGEDRPLSQRVFITNTVKCRPPGNRNPQAEELAACAPILQRQVREVQPRVVLAMGRFAAQSLLQSDLAIGRLRGTTHSLPGTPSVQVVATYHPAYLLRNPIDKSKAWEDLCRAAELLDAAS